MANDKVTIDFEANLGPLMNKLAGLATLIGGAFTFAKMIENAMEAEDAVNKLNIALQQQGKFTQEASDAFQEYAAHLQATTGFSDDLIISNASLLVSIGKLSGEGLNRATDAALDLAAATGKDLNTIFAALAKAADGGTAGLAKFGIRVDESLPKSERFAAALKMIEQQLGNMAEGRLNTFSGALTRLTNGFGDVLEELGKLFTQSPLLRDLINIIASGFEKAALAVTKFAKGGDFVQMLAQTLIDFARVITQYVLPPLELLSNIGKVVWTAMQAQLQTVVMILAKVADGFATIGNAVGLVSDESAAKIAAFSESAAAEFDKRKDDFRGSMTDIFKFDASVAADNFVTQTEEFVNLTRPAVEAAKSSLNPAASTEGALSVGDAFSTTLQGMSSAAREFADNASANFKKVGAAMFQSLGNAAGQAFAAFGKAVAKGENAIGAFLNSLLASFGQMAIQLGTQFILQGIAYSWAGMPNGPALIAAGAALAAFGGILSAVGGGAGGGGATAGAAGGGGAVGTAAAPTTEGLDTLQDPRQRAATINVEIQGNVLDRRQTGLEIAEVIQETFGSNGIVFST